MADTKLSALATGTPFPTYFYGEQSGTSKRYNGYGLINLKDYGAVGDGSTDDTTAIQNAVNAVFSNNGTLIVPPGNYKMTSNVTCDPGGGGECGFKMFGTGQWGCQFSGQFNGFLFNVGNATTGLRAHIDGIRFSNTSTGSSSGCLNMRGCNNSHVSNCVVGNSGGFGIKAFDTNFACCFSNLELIGSENTDAQLGTMYANGSIGIQIGQHTAIYNLNMNAYAVGLRAYGPEIVIYNTRAEVNGAAMNLGFNGTGASEAISAFDICGGSFESNLVGINIQAGSYGSFRNLSIHGSSDVIRQMHEGVHVYGGTNINWDNIVVSATHNAPATNGFDTSDWDFSGASGPMYLNNCTGAGSEATAQWVYGSNKEFIHVRGVGPSSSNGAVTQSSSKSTGVTLNNANGAITMNGAALGSNTAVQFTLTNSYVSSGDVVVASIASAATASAYTLTVDAVSSGSCKFSLKNVSAGSLSESIIINYKVIKDCL